MQIIYIVYREDNTLVFNSQVLEYLKLLKSNNEVDLILFRNHENFFKKEKVEKQVSSYIKRFKTFTSLPPLTVSQLDLDAFRLKKSLTTNYREDDDLLILCRGELSTYIASKAFINYKNKIILFDNRGLPIEELEMRNKKSIIYKLNKRVKKKAILYSKDNCDIYSFVTNNLRNYLIEKYNYQTEKKYFIMPTLNSNYDLDSNVQSEIYNEINYNKKNFYVIYIGSVAAWQNVDKVFNVFIKIKKEITNSKLLILTNGKVSIPESISKEIIESTYIKSVSHEHVKYYLNISNVGIVIRNNSIVNKVAAPTKIAEYLSNNVPILYEGTIGIIDDLVKQKYNFGLINLEDIDWVKKVKSINGERISCRIRDMYRDYFDMEKNQKKLMNEITKRFVSR